MNAPALGFHEEEQVITRARQCLEEEAGTKCPTREEFQFLLSEYEKLFRQSMRLVRMGDRMQNKLSKLNDALNHKQEELLHMAATDALTGLCNRRAFMEHAGQELARAARHGSALSLLLLDADKFKQINDTFGHDAGDKVLQKIASIGKHAMRTEDTFARFGGEEFIALLPSAACDDALRIAERLRLDMERSPMQHENVEVCFTVSIGVASLSEHCNTVEHLIKTADLGLYAAKDGGRNRVAMHECPAAAHVL